jgi:hypothetical protein
LVAGHDLLVDYITRVLPCDRERVIHGPTEFRVVEVESSGLVWNNAPGKCIALVLHPDHEVRERFRWALTSWHLRWN